MDIAATISNFMWFLSGIACGFALLERRARKDVDQLERRLEAIEARNDMT